MNSIYDIDLSPKKGKKYWKNCHRKWREEFIYFLMVGIFRDNAKRHPLNFPERHTGFGDSLKHEDQSIRFIKIYLQPMQFVILKNK